MRTRKGFTLIELLVVIGIIAILMGIIRPMLSASASKTREFQCESNLRQIGMAMRAYAEDYGALPQRLLGVDAVLQDRDALACPQTSRLYYYHKPAGRPGRDDVIASCINPERLKRAWPHEWGKCYLALSAGGGVRRVSRR